MAFLCLRISSVVQLLTSVPGALPRATRPLLDVGLVLLFTAHSTVLALRLRRHRGWTRSLAWTDVAVGCVVLLGQAAITAPTDRLDTWDAWGYAVTLSCAMAAGVGLRRLREMLVASLLLMGCYLWESVLMGQVAQWSTAVTNSVAYVAFAAAGWVSARYLRRFGADADTYREQAAAMAATAEGERHRRLLHDQATVLAMLSQDVADPDLLAALRRQAASGASRISSFLHGSPHPTDAGTLGGSIRSAAEDFTDLPLTVNVDLVDDLPVDPQVAVAVREAITTLLHNVRVHAQATTCVLHADTEGTAFEVTVRDDGVGFDPGTSLAAGRTTGGGFGLSRQVVEPLRHLGIAVEVTSSPGAGTTITLTGRTAGTTAPVADPGDYRGPPRDS